MWEGFHQWISEKELSQFAARNVCQMEEFWGLWQPCWRHCCLLDTNKTDETLFRGKLYSTPWWPDCIILCLHNKLKHGTINFLGNDRHIFRFSLDLVEYLKGNNLSSVFNIQIFFLLRRSKKISVRTEDFDILVSRGFFQVLLFLARRICPHACPWAGHIKLDLLQLSCWPSPLLFKGGTCVSALQACHSQRSHHYQDKKVPQATLLWAHLSSSGVLPLPASCLVLLLNLHPWVFSVFYAFLENVTIGSTVLLKPMYIYFPRWPIVFSSE